MREILFRGKVKDKEELLGKGFPIDENGNLKSEWVFGVPIPHYPDLFLAWNEACNEYEEVTIIPETIGECVNVSDKNGTRIFEGDILKGLYANGNAEVKMINGSWVGYAGKGWTDIGYVVERVEVIGNIHDNPELLVADVTTTGRKLSRCYVSCKNTARKQ